jgi:peptide/nickel transport system permease protein
MEKIKKAKKYSRSLTYYAWRKLKRNRLSMIGLVFISICVVVAVAGSILRPDSTPMANEMILQLTTKEPGFKAKIIKIRKNSIQDNTPFFNKFFFGGKENEYALIPINNYWFQGEDIVIEKYSEATNGSAGQIIRLNVADVIYPIDLSSQSSVKLASGKSLSIALADQTVLLKTIDEIQKEIILKNIVEQTFWLGTDRFGRDLLSRIMAGTLVSLSVGFISVVISILIGIVVGSIGGFFRGRLDDFIVWLINVVWAIPTLLLVIAITLVLGKGFWQVFIAVGLTMWVEVARVIRGQILGIREKEYVEAGKAMGFTDMRLIFKHILPNVLGPVIVISAANFASAILIEAGLSFLGIGAQPPMASWGTMIRDHYGYIITGKAYLAVFPGMAIMLMVLAFMLVGNGLRDAMDSKVK